MAYNADLATATSMAPQLGTLTSSSTPTSTQATVIWTGAYDRVRAALLANGISSSITASTVADAWAQRCEMMITSGEVLLAKGSIGVNAESTAPALLALADSMIESLPTIRIMLLDNGATADKGSTDSRIGSHWTRAKDPDWDPAPGGDDVPYAAVPVWPDNSDL
ncbi:hypothetical protein CMI37_38290 [Candidatus Pacearchaeota archaeon]|nr:hypothetical protein [Candidatus Pacearchaeota archaeon]